MERTFDKVSSALLKHFDSYKIPVLSVIYSITVFRALHLSPHYYILTHYLYSYKYGFTRRALIGTILSPLFQDRTNEEIVLIITIFFGIILSCFFISLFLKWTSFSRGNSALFSAGFVFFTSPFISSIANYFAYFDLIIYLTAFAGIWLIVKDKNIFIIMIINIAGLLIHENYLAACFPMIVFVLVIRHMFGTGSGESLIKRRKSLLILIIKIICLVIPLVAIFLFIFNKTPSGALQTDLKEMKIMSQFWITIGTHMIKVSFDKFWLTGLNFLTITDILAVLPTALFYAFLSLYIINRNCNKPEEKLKKIFLMTLSLSVIAAPVPLVIVALDAGRIISFSNMNSFVVFAVLVRYTDRKMIFSGIRERGMLILSALAFSVYNLLIFNKLMLLFFE